MRETIRTDCIETRTLDFYLSYEHGYLHTRLVGQISFFFERNCRLQRAMCLAEKRHMHHRLDVTGSKV